FSGRTTEMTDYLAEQIVADLPEPLRQFLLETCILERFNARLADAVRDRSDSEDLLEQLRHFDALLIPLDNAREWFRYHPLFADYLYQRLKRSSAQRPVILRRRAALALAATTLDTAGPRTRRDFVIVQSLWQGYVDQVADKECIAAVEAHCRGLDPSDHLGRGTLTCEIAVTALGQGALERAEAESRR